MAVETRKALEKSYREGRPALVRRLAGLVDPDRAEDLLHDVVARALANIDALEPVRDMSAWLWAACKNAVVDAWRAAGRRRAAGEIPVEDFDALMDRAWRGAQDDLERQELLGLLRQAMDRLPPDQRLVLEEQVLKGKTFRALSAETGLSIDTLAARKRYALGKLRTALKDYMEES